MKKLLLLLLTTLLLNAESQTNYLGMRFVDIPSGSFMMGRDASLKEGGDDELPRHKESISRFAIQTTKVTQIQWIKVMGSNPSKHKGRNNPVSKVSYNDIQEFIKKLNEKEKTNIYRLPTEAEWEYVARAGTDSIYVCGETKECLNDYAWYENNSEEHTHPVREKKPNNWGLYDISGNVWEWTSSCYTKNYTQGCYREGAYKILRGGSWFSVPETIRLSNRYYSSPENHYIDSGFRLAKTLP